MVLQAERYGSWDVEGSAGTAFRFIDGVPIQIALQYSTLIHAEGWWPARPSKFPCVVIAGVCLWDGRWRLKFKPTNQRKGTQPAIRSLALQRDRDDAYTRLEQGKHVAKILFPETLGEYHDLLLSWQAEKLQELQPQQVLYHLPRGEYHYYIWELERFLGPLPVLHECLDVFADKVKERVMQMTGNVQFISPMQQGAQTPLESFMFPYLHPEVFGVSREDLMGLEDLDEVRLSFTAWQKTGSVPTPVFAGILKNPSPYLDKNIQDGVRELVLESSTEVGSG